MLASLVVVFREVLEAALIVSVVLAACKGLPHRNRWAVIGVATGVAGALVVASLAEALSAAAAGMGSEIFNAAILSAAVLMLGWHSVWMAQHGRELAQSARTLGDGVAAGSRPLYAIAVVIGVAVLREGAETVLFLYGIAASGGSDGLAWMLVGGGAGVVLGIALGALLYAGLLALSVRPLFAVTNTLLLLMAAGLAAQAAGFLVQADILPAWGDGIWDTSAILSEKSIPGKLLHTLIGYVARPAGVQLAVYGATLAVILAASRAARPARVSRRAVMGVLAGGVLVVAAMPAPVRAEFQVRSPIVSEGEIEIEHNGAVLFSRNKATRWREQSYTNELAYSPTSWWRFEIETELGHERGDKLRYEATTLENVFQLTPQGKYFLDVGFFIEYSKAARRDDQDTVKLGPIVQKELGRALLTVNAFFERAVSGPGSTGATAFVPAVQAVYRLHPLFAPGIEYYGEIADIGDAGRLRDQEHRLGPVVVGAWRISGATKLKYELGYLLPLTHAAHGGALRWKLELEFRL